ncbi:LORF1 [Gallid alphaherpesvirus 2]|nr:LORF1 [Gallid alphaherpesvirus 2]UOW64451.1 LORF1 [Gallid alphaherpesvirus 2]
MVNRRNYNYSMINQTCRVRNPARKARARLVLLQTGTWIFVPFPINAPVANIIHVPNTNIFVLTSSMILYFFRRFLFSRSASTSKSIYFASMRFREVLSVCLSPWSLWTRSKALISASPHFSPSSAHSASVFPCPASSATPARPSAPFPPWGAGATQDAVSPSCSASNSITPCRSCTRGRAKRAVRAERQGWLWVEDEKQIAVVGHEWREGAICDAERVKLCYKEKRWVGNIIKQPKWYIKTKNTYKVTPPIRRRSSKRLTTGTRRCRSIQVSLFCDLLSYTAASRPTRASRTATRGHKKLRFLYGWAYRLLELSRDVYANEQCERVSVRTANQ